jgi:hypothetical protein
VFVWELRVRYLFLPAIHTLGSLTPTQIHSYQAITCKHQRIHAGARLFYIRMRIYKVVQRYGEITKEKNVFMEKRQKKGFSWTREEKEHHK